MGIATFRISVVQVFALPYQVPGHSTVTQLDRFDTTSLHTRKYPTGILCSYPSTLLYLPCPHVWRSWWGETGYSSCAGQLYDGRRTN
jgi:hypothetical protein